MELYKTRYNLYNYLIDNDTYFNLLNASLNLSKYFIISIYIIFIIIIISNTTDISYIIFFFILIGIILIYLIFLLDTKITNIKENDDFINYCILFRLFNNIFNDSYNSNQISNYIKNNNYPSKTEYTLTQVIEFISLNNPVISNRNNFYIEYNLIPNTKDINYIKNINNNYINLKQLSYRFVNIENYNINENFDNINFKINNINNQYAYLKFKNGINYLELKNSITCDLLIVGGGGGGSIRINSQTTDKSDCGGGGGGGQVIYRKDFTLSNGLYKITVGNGGTVGADGEISSIIKINSLNQENIIINAGGGGRGISGIYNSSNIIKTGSGGGGGGSRSSADIIDDKTTGILYYGSYAEINGLNPKSANGGNGLYNKLTLIGYGGGGGGGIPNNLYNPLNNINGNGGIGMDNDITGNIIGYGGGGAGGCNDSGGIYHTEERKRYFDASYGGGNGGGIDNTLKSEQALDALSGLPNTGGGGGGYGGKISLISKNGGSGVVIIKLLVSFINKDELTNNNIFFQTENSGTRENPIIILSPEYIIEDIIIVKNPNSKFYIIIEHNYINQNNIYIKICEYLNNYYDNFKDIIILLNNNKKYEYNYLYLIDLEELEKNINGINIEKSKSLILKEIYNLLKEYFVSISNFNLVTTDNKILELISSATDNKNYINAFYNTLIEINNNLKYFENISKENIYEYTDGLVKNNQLLKFIDIYDNDKYLILKKYIFIYIDLSNELHKYIIDGYDTNKDLKVSEINNPDGKIISNVLIDISTLYNPGTVKKYFLIDIEKINEIIKDKDNDIDKKRSNLNIYISNIYNKLIKNYNYNINLNKQFENFDILFNKNNNIDKKIELLLDDYNYIYNLIIIVLIILFTIVFHIFYIELFKYL